MNAFLHASIISLNLLAFALYGIDKGKAKRHAWRIPERTLLLFALLAPVGAGQGMICFHHKVRKARFHLAVAAGLCLWAALVHLFI